MIAETQDGGILAPSMPTIVTLRPLVSAVSTLIAPLIARCGIAHRRRRTCAVSRRRSLLAATPAPWRFAAPPRLVTILVATLLDALGTT